MMQQKTWMSREWMVIASIAVYGFTILAAFLAYPLDPGSALRTREDIVAEGRVQSTHFPQFNTDTRLELLSNTFGIGEQTLPRRLAFGERNDLKKTAGSNSHGDPTESKPTADEARQAVYQLLQDFLVQYGPEAIPANPATPPIASTLPQDQDEPPRTPPKAVGSESQSANTKSDEVPEKDWWIRLIALEKDVESMKRRLELETDLGSIVRHFAKVGREVEEKVRQLAKGAASKASDLKKEHLADSRVPGWMKDKARQIADELAVKANQAREAAIVANEMGRERVAKSSFTGWLKDKAREFAEEPALKADQKGKRR